MLVKGRSGRVPQRSGVTDSALGAVAEDDVIGAARNAVILEATACKDGRARTRQMVGGTDLPGNSSLNCFAYWRLPTRRHSTFTERGMPA